MLELVSTRPRTVKGEDRYEVYCAWFGVKAPQNYPQVSVVPGQFEFVPGYSGYVIDNLSDEQVNPPREEVEVAAAEEIRQGGMASATAVRPPDATTPPVGLPAPPYSPTGQDTRPRVPREVADRRGQKEFRDGLRARYRDTCLVTGCRDVAVLEAAHINPYRGENDHHLDNGLLLRADIHTLFDLDLIGIHPQTYEVHIHPELSDQYQRYAGNKVSEGPSKTELDRRFVLFEELRRQSGAV